MKKRSCNDYTYLNTLPFNFKYKIIVVFYLKQNKYIVFL